MDARRLELYDLLKPKLDEEPARRLVLALPAAPERLVTVDHLEATEERLRAHLDTRMAELGTRMAQLEAVLTRRMIAAIGAWSVLIASAITTAAALFGG